MTYTITGARYANPDHTATVIETVEASSVLVSPQDTPDAWAAMLRWGEPEPYEPGP